MTKDKYMEVLVHKKNHVQDKISQAQDKISNIDEIIYKLLNSKQPVKLHELTEDERARLLGRMVSLEDLHARNLLSQVLWL
jgi:hypothetical protein